MVDGGPRKGSKYATLTDILAVCAKGAEHGLSHSGQARLIGETLLVWREVLHHESGESIYTEHPIPVPDKGLPGQRQQDLGGAITYARKYCLQGLYGLLQTMGLILTRSATAMPELLKRHQRRSKGDRQPQPHAFSCADARNG